MSFIQFLLPILVVLGGVVGLYRKLGMMDQAILDLRDRLERVEELLNRRAM